MPLSVAMVYGGGGPFATAYGMGVAEALRQEGVSLQAIPTLGTSGGAWAAAAVLAGFSHERVVEVTRHVTLPDLRPGRLHTASRELFGERKEPMLWTAAVRLRDGRRTLLSGADHLVADIVAASSSVPWMVVPQRIGAHYYLDGGARSWTSADLAPRADRLLVVAPGVAPSFGRFGVALRAHLAFEIRRWKRRTGGRVRVLRVEEELGHRVTRWKHLFDGALAQEAHEQARAMVVRDLSIGGRLHDFLAP